MDPYKLLSRSSKIAKRKGEAPKNVTPSTGQVDRPQFFAEQTKPQTTRKRKRGEDGFSKNSATADGLDFFASEKSQQDRRIAEVDGVGHELQNQGEDTDVLGEEVDIKAGLDAPLSLEERKHSFKQHKLKATWLNPPTVQKKDRRKSKDKTSNEKKSRHPLNPQPLQSFQHMRSSYGTSKALANNVADQGFSSPTEVQMGALPLLLDDSMSYLSESCDAETLTSDGVDLLTVAPTGSGKTLAFMVPLLRNLQKQRRGPDEGRSTSAIVLAPTKELTGQIVNEGRKLAKGTGLKITQMRKGMRFEAEVDDINEEDGVRARVDLQDETIEPVVKADIIVSTPGLFQRVAASSPTSLSAVRYLVLDEADVLLDPLFRDQTLDIWRSLKNPSLRVSMWSATMGSNIEELARSTINERRLALQAETQILEAPLIRLVVGLKDSAVPNVQHKLIYTATEQGKLMGLRQLLHPTTSNSEAGPPLRPPFLVFTQTIERAVALHSELLYDIPAEAGGINRIAVLHSDLSDTARDGIMTRFRKGEIWVLITTDLLSRGVDFRGINGVVNYDIPTSSAAYVHRVGRTGRAGREGGVAFTLYSKEDIPYLKHVATVVTMAQKQSGQQGGVQQWLLDALPTLSKNEKHDLKKRGIESRTARGKQKDPKAARKARISSKSGFVRQAENKRKGAIVGSQRRAQEVDSDAGDDTDFGGFD